MYSNMGFGSYDGSKQQNQKVDTDPDEETVHIHESDLNFETDKSTDEVVNQLQHLTDLD